MSFAAEDRLLIQCSRVNMSAEAIAIASDLIQQQLDWDYILEVSIRHGVSPLFYFGLTQLAQAAALDTLVPAHILAELEQLYRSTQTRNRRLYGVIGEIAKAFERIGVAAIGLKDVHLAREVYPDIGLRPMGDIDILIHREDYEKVAACMAELGFVPLPGPNIPFTLKYAWAHHFHRPADNVWVDMQWNVLQREWDTYQEGNFDFEIARVWRNAISMMVDDYRILVPKIEDMFFHLCLHLEGHEYCELILFADIAELLRRYEGAIDWEYIVSITKQYTAESSVYYVLFLLQRLFAVALPEDLLCRMRPAYFNANLLTPLFGNLTLLHLSLDQIRLATAPPDGTMRKLEAIVRHQAIGAMHAYRAIDTIAAGFMRSGGCMVVLEGDSPEKVFPEPALRSFGDIRLLILERDVDRMLLTLAAQGFGHALSPDPEAYMKQEDIVSADPALAGKTISLILKAEIEQGIGGLIRSKRAHSMSKRDLAIKSIKAKLSGRMQDLSPMTVPIRIAALTQEEMLVYLSARLGERTHERLFGLCSVLEFFRGYTGTLDWQQIAGVIQRYGLRKAACCGLAMVEEFVHGDRLDQAALDALRCPATAPHVLEWARYDPASWGRYGGFRSAFLYLFSLLSIDGTSAKLQYVLRSLVGSRRHKPILLGLMLEVVASIFALFRRKQRSTRDFAYWIESTSPVKTEAASK
jgi:hypothetical protein